MIQPDHLVELEDLASRGWPGNTRSDRNFTDWAPKMFFRPFLHFRLCSGISKHSNQPVCWKMSQMSVYSNNFSS